MIIDSSPFPHQGPLRPEQVVGREALVHELLERVTERRVTTLLGPRRFGKTSVLRRVAADLEMAGSSVFWIDTYAATSWGDVVERFDKALDSVRGPVRAWLDSYAASVGITLGPFRAEVGLSAHDDAVVGLHARLDAIIAASRSQPVTCVFDEFGGIFGIDGVAGLTRTKLQHHFQDIGLLFAGSQPTIITKMFADRSMPFYAQSDLIEVEPFDSTTTVELVNAGFAATKRDANGLGGKIYSFTAGHPYRTMQLADAAWRTVMGDKHFDSDDWPSALQTVRQGAALGFEALYSNLAQAEQTIVRLLANGQPLFGSVAAKLGLSSSSAYAGRDRLVASGEIRRVDDEYRVVDPLFADFLRGRF